MSYFKLLNALIFGLELLKESVKPRIVVSDLDFNYELHSLAKLEAHVLHVIAFKSVVISIEESN